MVKFFSKASNFMTHVTYLCRTALNKVKFVLTFIAIAFSSMLAISYPSEKLITTCYVDKTAYAHINTDFSKEEKDKTSFKVTEGSGEAYKLSKITKVMDSNDLLLAPLSFYNISYESSKYPMFNWNAADKIINKTEEIAAETLNKGRPLVIRISYPGTQEQVYFFNIDTLGNGTMTMVNTRWSSFLDAANNQSLVFAICKN